MTRLLAAAVLAAALFALASAEGAPVPPPPRLSEAALVGTWRYAWSVQKDGWIRFHPDGTYRAQHHAAGQHYIGQWWVYGGAVYLREFRYAPERNEVTGGPQVYQFELSAAANGWAGTSGSVTPVALSERRE